MITISDPEGRVLLSGSSGTSGFKGARKSTPFAASTTALSLAKKAIASWYMTRDASTVSARTPLIKHLETGLSDLQRSLCKQSYQSFSNETIWTNPTQLNTVDYLSKDLIEIFNNLGTDHDPIITAHKTNKPEFKQKLLSLLPFSNYIYGADCFDFAIDSFNFCSNYLNFAGVF